jgi:hypothetical protein
LECTTYSPIHVASPAQNNSKTMWHNYRGIIFFKL